jgi:hypothetical protein
MKKLTNKQLEILQSLTEIVDTEKYYEYTVEQKSDGIYLIPDFARWIGDEGEFMGNTFLHAKANIKSLCEQLRR